MSSKNVTGGKSRPLTESELVRTKIEEMQRICMFHENIDFNSRKLDDAEGSIRGFEVGEVLGEPERSGLVSSDDRKFVKRVCRHRSLRLPVFGSNGVGKSSFLNVLLGGKFMPAQEGLTTARICLLSYSSFDEAHIKYWSLSDLIQGSTTHVSHLSADEKSVEGLCTRLKRELSREFATDATGAPLHSNSPNFAKWVETIVEVCYPFPILAGGLTLIDVPGIAKSDAEAVQEHILSFFRAEPPFGVIFMFDNPSFSDNEMAAMNVLLKLTADLSHENIQLFLLNTKADNLREYCGDLPDPTDAAAIQRYCLGFLEHRYKLVRGLRSAIGPFSLPPTAAEFGPFCAISTQQYSLYCLNQKKGIRPTSLHQTHRYLLEDCCIGGLLDWAIECQRQRFLSALKCMSRGACVFFGNLLTARENRLSTALRERANAQRRLSILQKELTDSLEMALSPNSIQTRIQKYASQEDVMVAIKEQARRLQLGLDLDDMDISYVNLPTAHERFAMAFLPRLREYIFERVLMEVLHEVRNDANAKVRHIADQARNVNVLLSNALQNFWMYDDTVDTAIQRTTVNTADKFTTLVKLFVRQRNVSDAIKAAFRELKQVVKGRILINGDWKAEHAVFLLTQVHTIFDNREIIEKCQKSIDDHIGVVQSRIERCVSQVQTLQGIAKTSPESFEILRNSVTELLVSCHTDRSYLCNEPPRPIQRIPHAAGQATSYQVGTETVKVFVDSDFTLMPGALHRFYDEVHFNSIMGTLQFGHTNLNTRHVMRVEVNPSSGHSVVISALAKPSKGSLVEWHLVSSHVATTLRHVLLHDSSRLTELNCIDLFLSLAYRAAALCECGIVTEMTLDSMLLQVTKDSKGNLTEFDTFPTNVHSVHSSAGSQSKDTPQGYLAGFNTVKNAQTQLLTDLFGIFKSILPVVPLPSQSPISTEWNVFLTSHSSSPQDLVIQLQRMRPTLISFLNAASSAARPSSRKPRATNPFMTVVAPSDPQPSAQMGHRFACAPPASLPLSHHSNEPFSVQPQSSSSLNGSEANRQLSRTPAAGETPYSSVRLSKTSRLGGSSHTASEYVIAETCLETTLLELGLSDTTNQPSHSAPPRPTSSAPAMVPSVNTDKLLKNHNQRPKIPEQVQKSFRILNEKDVLFNLKQKYAIFDILPWDESLIQEDEAMEFLIKLPDGKYFLVLIAHDVDVSAVDEMMSLAQDFLQQNPLGGIILMHNLNGEMSANIPLSWIVLHFSPD